MMLKFLVKGQKIEILEREVIASDQIAFVTLKFVFDGDWKKFHKVVQFTQCDETYNRVLCTDGLSCLLPAELHAGAVKLSVFGYDADNTSGLRATTVPVTLHIRASGFVGEDADSPIPPTPDLYTQLLQKIGEVQHGKDGADGLPGKDGTNGKDGRDGIDGKDGVSPDLTNYPDTDAVKALVQAAVQPLLQQTHIHKNLDVLDDLTANELSLLRALQEFEDDTTYNIQTFREAIAALNEKAHTHENQVVLDQITAAKIAQWDAFGTQINGLSTKVTVYSEKVENNTSRIGTAERTLESLQKQIDNLTSGRNYTILFQSGQNAVSTYASNLSMILDGGYQTMTDFLAAYPQFCSAANDFVLSYSQECFNWDKLVLTVCTKSLSLTKNAEIVMSYQSGSSEAGRLYLVQKPQKIDIPIGVYVNTEIDANRAVSLDFQWLQSDTFITTITECTSISDGEYYLAWVGRSNNSHPKIRFLKVLEG